MCRYQNLDLIELERRLCAIDTEEINKVQNVCESYDYTRKVIEHLMAEKQQGRSDLHRSRSVPRRGQRSLDEEEDDVDISKCENP